MTHQPQLYFVFYAEQPSSSNPQYGAANLAVHSCHVIPITPPCQNYIVYKSGANISCHVDHSILFLGIHSKCKATL